MAKEKSISRFIASKVWGRGGEGDAREEAGRGGGKVKPS